MKIWQVILALLISIGILVGSEAYKLSIDEPGRITSKSGDFTLSHVPVRSHAGTDTSPFFTARFDGPVRPGTPEVILHYFPTTGPFEGEETRTFIKLQMPLGEEAIDDYDVFVPPLEPGTYMDYYITADTNGGKALVTLPEGASADSNFLTLKFEGIVPAWVTVLYLSFSYAALLSAILLCFKVLGSAGAPEDWKLIAAQCVWTGIFFLLGFDLAGYLHDHFKWASQLHIGWPLLGPWPAFILSHMFGLTIISLYWWARTRINRIKWGQSLPISTAFKVVNALLTLSVILTAISAFSD